MSKALLRFVRLSPTKARLIAREIQGMNAEIVLASAIANGNYEAGNVEVASCRIDTGPVLRRFTPRARGRATPIRKPTSHIFVEVAEMIDKKPTKHSSRRGKKVAQSEDK